MNSLSRKTSNSCITYMSSYIGTIRFVFSCEPNRGEVNKCAGAASQHSAFDHSVTAHGSACKGKQSDASIRNHECLVCDTGRKTIIQWEVPEGFFKKFTCCCRKGKGAHVSQDLMRWQKIKLDVSAIPRTFFLSHTHTHTSVTKMQEQSNRRDTVNFDLNAPLRCVR